MRVAAAYAGVVLVWSTTPLAIKWSGEGPGFLFAAASRMAIGTACVLLLLAASRQRLPVHRAAIGTYAVGAIQIYGAMLAVYWAAQFIPSGWVSVLFGATPILTAVFAALFLGERSLGYPRIFAYLLGILGLKEIFGSAALVGPEAVLGIAGVLSSSLLQSLSAVWIKRINARLTAIQVVAGSLVIALPFYLVTWWLFDGNWPEALPRASVISTLYLGVFATTVGFALYFFILQRLSATRVALVSLVSPLLALAIGHLANHEPFSLRIARGTALILTALLVHSFAGRMRWGRDQCA